jgi:beta-glucosidase
MEADVHKLVALMTLEEKAGLCSGLDLWHTKPIDRLSIPSIMVADGPHGLRKQGKQSEQLSTSDAIAATCFPTGSALASSWDVEVLRRVGEALGKEAKAEGVSVLLGPAANIKRSPLCGRNFEYFSEDPYLSSHLGAAYIEGVQSMGVGTSLKHFAVNNQESNRFTLDTIVSERALHEIYLSSFEYAILSAKPWTIMSAYNKVNGQYASEHPYLLDAILRKRWNFEGVVMTDWGANHDRVAGLRVGEDLEMPGNGALNDRKIVEAVRNGELGEKVLDEVVIRMLKLIKRSVEATRSKVDFSPVVHHHLAKEIAQQCMVLLKNEGNVLPLSCDSHILVVGPFAKQPRYQGGGSSHINPTFLSNAFDAMARCGDVRYTQGFSLESGEASASLEEEARAKAKEADIIVFFAGLPDSSESEAYDRTNLALPSNQVQLINALAGSGVPLVVALSNGAPIEMPWADKAQAILECYLAGQASGEAVSEILFGTVNPSGKLAETFPLRLEDTPSFLNFPGCHEKVMYAEDIFVGYRWYDARALDVLFPFGHGLSYTTFTLYDVRMEDGIIGVTIQNTGEREGRQVVQLYVEQPGKTVPTALRELKGFVKVHLLPEERKRVQFILTRRDFSYFDERISDWVVEGGLYRISLGFSSRELLHTIEVDIRQYMPKAIPITADTMLGDVLASQKNADLLAPVLSLLPFDLEGEDKAMMRALVSALPIRALVPWSHGVFSEAMMDDLVMKLQKRLG